MLKVAEARLRDHTNVDVRLGTLEALPIDNGQLDIAIMALVLHHVPDPRLALAECARVLGPRGRLLIIDMLPHDRAEYQQQMGHVWLGFPEAQLRRLLGTARFDAIRVHALPIDEEASGPALFVAVATRV
jgi:ArsR family transcriptional regulator